MLADIVQSSDDAIFSRKLDGTISSWNRGAEHIFGYKAGEIIGQPSRCLLPSDRTDETDRLFAKIRRGERVEHFETLRLRKDGRQLVVSLKISPILDSRGRVVGASTIARDVTAQRELEALLLESGDRERRRLGRDLHDGLGQQLSGMDLVGRSLARSIARRKLPDVKLVRSLVSHIHSVTAQIRALARGLSPVVESPDGLMTALSDLVTATHLHLRVKCTFTCTEPVLIQDHAAAVHFFRIAQEAIANALRHGRARRIEVSLTRREEVSLVIRDNGRGFKKASSPPKGMGLRAMQYRARVLGGTLQYGNVPPKGAMVSCSVPVARTETKQAIKP